MINVLKDKNELVGNRGIINECVVQDLYYNGEEEKETYSQQDIDDFSSMMSELSIEYTNSLTNN